jgi:membrane protease YdiL (CAAX protease family)
MFPIVIGVVGGALTFVYVVGLAVLLLVSLRIRAAPFPGLLFSFSWLALFFEGQVAFLFLLAFLTRFTVTESLFLGVVLAGIPIIFASAKGFPRQPWGKPFAWPLRLGDWKVLLFSVLLLLLSWVFNLGFAQLIAQITHHPMPLQRTMPLIRDALRSNPVVAVLAIGVFAPITEEILFRGLMFGALKKWLQAGWVIFWTSLLFALVHLEIVGLLPILALSALLGWVRWKTGSVGLPMLLHALNNSFAMLALMFQRN